MPIRIAERWFERKRIADDITLLWEPHVDALMRCNIWHVRGRDRDLVIDTGTGVSSLATELRDLIDKPLIAVATHVHADHIGGHHEFADCLCHAIEAPGLEAADADATLVGPEFDPENLGTLRLGAYKVSGPLLTAYPHAGYDPRSYRIHPARVTHRVDDGDRVDLGDRHFLVLHLPGHSPGSIGLWEPASAILFSGDAVYDSELIDGLGHSSIPDYIGTMERLAALPVRIVHAGHCPSFGQARLRELTAAYLELRG